MYLLKIIRQSKEKEKKKVRRFDLKINDRTIRVNNSELLQEPSEVKHNYNKLLEENQVR